MGNFPVGEYITQPGKPRPVSFSGRPLVPLEVGIGLLVSAEDTVSSPGWSEAAWGSVIYPRQILSTNIIYQFYQYYLPVSAARVNGAGHSGTDPRSPLP